MEKKLVDKYNKYLTLEIHFSWVFFLFATDKDVRGAFKNK